VSGQSVDQEWLAEEQTPSGIQIRYGVKPKRMYQIRKGPKGRWKTVPSVTTVLDVLNKPGLPIWGQRVGIQGVLTLWNQEELRAAQSEQGMVLACASPEGGLVVADVPRVEALMKAAKLTTTYVRDAAGDRGQNVHDAFEAWAKEGTLPNPDLFPSHEQGYVAGLLAFVTESKAEPIASEVMVGSAKHGFAGRYDVRLRIPEPVELVVHHTPVRGAKREMFERGVHLSDLKTSKGVYLSHSLQLEAYEQASVECGYGPTDLRGVINVDAEGNYKYVRSTATFADYRAVLGVWKSFDRIERKRKESK
jgi:hypothetical protein